MSSEGDVLPVLRAAIAQLRDSYWWRRLKDPNNPWDQATSAAHIYLDELPAPAAADYSLPELAAFRPFCLLRTDLEGGYRWRTETSDFCCARTSGAIVLLLEMAVPPALAGSPTDLAVDLNLKLGRIMRTDDPAEPGILDLSGKPDYLPITEAHLSGYVRTPEKLVPHEGDAITCEILLRWGMAE